MTLSNNLEQAEGPRRAYELELKIGANTKEDLLAELKHLTFELDRDRLNTGVSGSPSVGSFHSYSHDPSWTKERYFKELDKSLAAASMRARGA